MIKQIADSNGIHIIMDVLQEECSELIQAISKHRRKSSNVTYMNIAEEIADVEIMIEEIIYKLDCRDMVDYYRDFKIKRQKERIENGKA